MHRLQSRSSSVPGLSPTLVVAISTGFGVVLLGLIITLVCLLIRSIRKHKRLLADLEHRGVLIAQQSQTTAKNAALTKPSRAVLRKPRLLPFNLRTGWGALPSVETVHEVGRTTEPTSVPAYYAPPKPAGFVEKPKRLSWPFSARSASGRAIRLRKIRAPPLSTVIESPKPSPLVPVLSGPHESASGTEAASSPNRQSHVRSRSDQSLLQHHPVFRGEAGKSLLLRHESSVDAIRAEPLRRSMTARPVAKTEGVSTRANRSNSIADIPLSEKERVVMARPQLHGRSASGNAPEGGLPPLPLQVALVRGSEARRRSLLSHSPSRVSNSSFESADTTILTQSSPLARNAKAGVKKVTKRDPRNVGIVTPRAVKNNTVVFHKKNHALQSSIRSSMARFSSVTSSTGPDQPLEFRHSMGSTSPSSQSLDRSSSFLSRRSIRTPKRKPATFVTPYGSPENRRKRSSILQGVSENHGVPARQLSQASTQASSTRSSNGNPFQWDPAPMSAGKPSNLKGSPLARKGHRRQNCVRLVIEPTVFGPRSRSSSPALMKDIQEESPPHTAPQRTEVKLDIGLGFTNRRSLPQPPTSSTFAPDVKFTTASSIRASLTPSSPTLSMVNYDLGPIGSPVRTYKARRTSTTPERSRTRMSTGSKFYVPTFPNPYDSGARVPDFANAPPTFTLGRSLNEDGGGGGGDDDDHTLAGASSPFEMLVDMDSSPPSRSPLLGDEYDPEHPQLAFRTSAGKMAMEGVGSAKGMRSFLSSFSTIPEELQVQQHSAPAGNENRPRAEDSPPCSPKTIPEAVFEPVKEESEVERRCSAFDLPIRQTAILEECEVIDPSLLSTDTFHSLNNNFDYNKNGGGSGSGGLSIFPSRSTNTINTKDEIPVPPTTASAKAILDPLINAVFPSSTSQDPPAPSSPRPRHTELPLSRPSSATVSPPSITAAPSLDFTTIPTLTPATTALNGPRGLPARPLRASIQELRRMNSDAEQKGSEREVRRWRRLGREDSIGLPGEESFLDGLDDEGTEVWFDEEVEGKRNDVGEGEGGEKGDGDVEDEEGEGESTWNEEKERRLVGDLLSEDWEEAKATAATAAGNNDEPQNRTKKENNTTTLLPTSKQTFSSTAYYPSSPPTTTPRQPSVRSPDRSSSIWEDGEKFWASTPPFPSTKDVSHPINHHHYSNPPTSPPPPQPIFHQENPPTPTTNPTAKKRTFSVAKDASDPNPNNTPSSSPPNNNNNNNNRRRRSTTTTPQQSQHQSQSRYRTINPNTNNLATNSSRRKTNSRKPRSTPLGIGSPNVRIQVWPPSSSVVDDEEVEEGDDRGTPGGASLYDEDGFLRG